MIQMSFVEVLWIISDTCALDEESSIVLIILCLHQVLQRVQPVLVVLTWFCRPCHIFVKNYCIVAHTEPNKRGVALAII